MHAFKTRMSFDVACRTATVRLIEDYIGKVMRIEWMNNFLLLARRLGTSASWITWSR